jgi:hypothetical protein
MKLKKNNAWHYRKIFLFLKTMESREIPSNICTIRNEVDKKKTMLGTTGRSFLFLKTMERSLETGEIHNFSFLQITK